MAGYDASDALDDIFGDFGDTEPDSEPETGQGDGLTAVAARTEAILDTRPTEPVELVVNLVRGLPELDDVQAVAADDTSELTETEKEQKGRTENIIRSAAAAGEAAIWVIAEALERAKKGRWWRASHSTYGEYVDDLTGRSASYVRRLRAGAPLALETAARTGLVQNPYQNREARKTEQEHGREAAVLLFQILTQVTGELGDKVTAESLAAARQQLPATLPELPEQKRDEIEQAARRAVGQGVSIDTLQFDSESNKSVSIDTPDPDTPTTTAEPVGNNPQTNDSEPDGDIIDAEIVREAVGAIEDAIATLTALNKAVTKDTLVQAAQETTSQDYAKLRATLLRKATTLQKKALHAPLAYEPAPACGTCGRKTALNPAEVGSAYWWCENCKTTQGARKPL